MVGRIATMRSMEIVGRRTRLPWHSQPDVSAYRYLCAHVFDRANSSTVEPMAYLARLCEEPIDEGGSSPDEGSPTKGTGQFSVGAPLMVVTG